MTRIAPRSIVKRLEADRGKPMREILIETINASGSRAAAAAALRIDSAYFYALCTKYGITVQKVAS